jgi:hypothetical protein
VESAYPSREEYFGQCLLHGAMGDVPSVRVSRQKRLAMLDAWRKENDHPLSPVVLEAAKKLITKGYSELAIDRGLEPMGEIQKYVIQYNALSIVYFACYDDQGRADAKYEEIVGSWRNASANNKNGKRPGQRR